MMNKKFSFVIIILAILILNSVFAVTRTDPIALNYSERKDSNCVEYLSGYKLQDFENGQRLFFILKDESENELSAPCYVDIRIVNALEETVFQKTFTLTKRNFQSWGNDFFGYHTMASIDIYTSDITPSKSEKGSLFFTVYSPGYFLFSEVEFRITDLPFNADYTNPLIISANKFDKTFDNPIKAKKDFGTNAIQLDAIAKSIQSNYDGTYSISCYDYSRDNSYSISLEFDKSQEEQLAEIDMDTKITVIGFVDYDSYTPTLIHCVIKH